MREVKPCPFCGGEDICVGLNEFNRVVPFCEKCGCSGPTTANAAWNARAIQPEVGGLVTALRQIENGDDWWAAQTASEALTAWEAAQK